MLFVPEAYQGPLTYLRRALPVSPLSATKRDWRVPVTLSEQLPEMSLQTALT